MRSEQMQRIVTVNSVQIGRRFGHLGPNTEEAKEYRGWHFRDGGLAGAVMVSGIYDLNASPLGDPEIAYFGSDPSRYAERSSLQGLLTTQIPLMIAAAELDPPRFVEQFNLLKQATCKGPSGCARATMVPQHSHMSEVYSINAVGTRLADEILNFVKTGK